MARPKGVIQKRNESKYWLPDGILLKEGQDSLYNKETKLIFIDPIYGEFISYFKALQLANASTHPEAVKKRRELTNIERFGGPNPSNSKEVREKAYKTMESRYGTKHALQNKELLKKSQETLFSNYGVYTTMGNPELSSKQKETLMKNYGVDNPMKSEIVRKKLSENNKVKYGVENPMMNPEIKERLLKNMLQNDSRMTSKGELELLDYVKSLGLDACKGYFGGNDPKEVDIKINDLKIAIEYNGEYWHSEANKQRKNRDHINKTELAIKNGYKLIHIFELQWENRKEQVKSFLRSSFKKNEIYIQARKTKFKEVDKNEAKCFLNKYHILGYKNHKYAYGLYLENELIALVTLGLHHRNSKELVLNRYVCKHNTTVSGGLSKLSKNIFKLHGEFTTWIDRMWSDGKSWMRAGWVELYKLPIDYFYYNTSKHEVITKQSRKKKPGQTTTEHEQALLDGLVRIYDCGKIKLVYKG